MLARARGLAAAGSGADGGGKSREARLRLEATRKQLGGQMAGLLEGRDVVGDGTTMGLRLGADFPRDEAEGALVREGVLSFLRSGAEAGYPDARTALAFLERFLAVRRVRWR